MKIINFRMTTVLLAILPVTLTGLTLAGCNSSNVSQRAVDTIEYTDPVTERRRLRREKREKAARERKEDEIHRRKVRHNIRQSSQIPESKRTTKKERDDAERRERQRLAAVEFQQRQRAEGGDGGSH